MDCSTPGFPVHHQLPELAQTQVHWVSVPSNHLILYHPLFLLPSIFPSTGVFSNESVLHIRSPNIGESASASVLPMNIQDWFPLGWTGWISLLSKGFSRVFSNITASILRCSTYFLVKLSHKVLGYNRLTMLWQFQVDSQGTQPSMYMDPFSPKLPSHSRCHITLSRIPCAIL